MRASEDTNTKGAIALVEDPMANTGDVKCIEKAATTSGNGAEEAIVESVSAKEANKIFRKVDIRLVPMLALLYLLSHLDRANIGNAKIEGLEADLGMTGTQYNLVNLIFFIPYVLAELPSNIILTKFKRASTWICILVCGWGTAMTLHGVVQNFAGLAATRAILGLFEAGFFPAAVFLIGRWYPPARTQTRMACFYCASAASGAFSGLLAAAIAQMDGVGGLEGWRWIFILEGLISVFLSEHEKQYLEALNVITRGRVQLKKKGERQGWAMLKEILKEGHIYLQAVVFAGAAIPLYGLKFTMPDIVAGMGFESTRAQLLTAPPYLCGAISALTSAWFADRLSWRMPFLVGPLTVLAIGFATIFGVSADIENNVGPAYFALFLVCVGIYPLLPGNQAWTSNNLAGPTKRAMGLGLMIMVGNLSGFVGSYIYIDAQAPTYPAGYGTSLAIVGCAICSCLTLEYTYWRRNKRNERFTEEEINEKYTTQELRDMGDRSPLFRFVY